MSTPKYSRLDPAQRRDQISTQPARCSPSAPTTRSRSRTSRALPASRAGSRTTISAGATRSTSRCSSGSGPTRGTTPAARRPQRPGAVADTVSRWLDWTEPTRRSGSPPSRTAKTSPTPSQARRRRTRAPRRHATDHFHDETAEISAAALRVERWTALNRAATRRDDAARPPAKLTHELLASTLEHVLRTFGARSQK